MNLPAACANFAWAASNWPACRRFHRALANPAGTQLELLRRLLARHAQSDYGRAHRFAAIRSYPDFARRVPLIEYEEIEPWIGRIQRGEGRALCSDPVQHLIPTSGSVGARKLIPFTAGLQKDFNRAIAPWICDLFCQHPALALGPAYWSITPAAPVQAGPPSAVPIGFDEDSRYLGGFRRRLVGSVMAGPAALRLVPDMELFRYLTLLCLLRQRDLRLISVWHPSFLTLLFGALPRHWDELLGDLQAGRCPRADALPAPVRSAMQSPPMPQRARELRRADPHHPEIVWPFLRLISCWRDAHAELEARQLEQRFPGLVIQAKGLLATEAFVTIPFGSRHPLAIRSHFFEFLGDDGQLRLAHELREGECHDVVVTTSGGLWRYRLHDRVQVTGFAGRTPSLRFLGKSNHVSDRFGEKLSEAFVAQAVREATATLPAPPRFAMLAPEDDELGPRYALYLEGPSSPELRRRLESALRQNPQYAWCRDLGQLEEIQIVPIECGGYESFVAREMTHGRRLGEIKPVALSGRTGWGQWFQGKCHSAPRQAHGREST